MDDVWLRREGHTSSGEDHLLPEMWGEVFKHLDVKALVKAQCACKLFYKLGNVSNLWQKLCCDWFTPLLFVKDHLHHNWKQTFKQVSQLDITGDWEVYMTIYTQRALYSYLTQYRRVKKRTFDHHTSCDAYVGEGHAEWGSFDILACNMGQMFSTTHIYRNSFLGTHVVVITNALRTLSADKTAFLGSWKSSWQKSAGYIYLRPVVENIQRESELSINQVLLNKTHEATQQPDWKREQTTELTCSWLVKLFLDHGITYECNFKLSGKKRGGFIGEVFYQTVIPQVKSTKVIGTMDGHFVSFGISLTYSHEITIITLIGQIIKKNNEIWLEGLLATEKEYDKENTVVNTGRFIATKIQKKGLPPGQGN